MASSETVAAIEKTVDVVEETLETIERIPKADLNGTTKKQQWIILGVTAATSFGVGATSAYFYAKRKFRLQYEELLDKEIDDAKSFYARLHKDGKFSDPTALVEERLGKKPKSADAQLNEYQELVSDYAVEHPAQNEIELVDVKESIKEAVVDAVEEGLQEASEEIRNVFEDSTVVDDFFDMEAEQARREELADEIPYVIHHDEFYENELDFTQVSLTYFEGDDVLVDERDQPVPDSDSTVGDGNLTKFGYGSKDKNIVYVRNLRTAMDFEIARSPKSYTQEVLGLDDELQHSDRRRHFRRFRGDDE